MTNEQINEQVVEFVFNQLVDDYPSGFTMSAVEHPNGKPAVELRIGAENIAYHLPVSTLEFFDKSLEPYARQNKHYADLRTMLHVAIQGVKAKPVDFRMEVFSV